MNHLRLIFTSAGMAHDLQFGYLGRMAMAPIPSTEGRSFQTLDALRGVAALLVLSRHTPDNSFEHLFRGSYLAVDLFFMLSGFVLAHAYRERLKGQLSIIEFMKLRYIRMAPLYLLALALETIFVVKSASSTGAIGASFLFSLLLLPTPPQLSVVAWALFPINHPAWSLFYEILINFIFALFARILNRLILAMVIVASMVALVVLSYKYGSLDFGATSAGWKAGLVRVSFGFFSGVGVHEIWKSGLLNRAIPGWILLVGLAALMSIPGANNASRVIDPMIVIFGFVPLVLFAANAHAGKRLTPVFTALGISSFGVYVLQTPIIHIVEATASLITSKKFSDFGAMGTVGIAILVTGVAIILHHYFDLPVRYYLKRRWTKSRKS